ncbi:TetR family transcriptional regulator [bacterium]|nr:TetR family transcriptional regulator [bacterium]
MTPQEPISEAEKRQVFFRAAEPLFTRFGFRKTTVDEICHDAGYSRGTFYDLFDNKQDMMISLVIEKATAAFEAWRREDDPSQPFLTRLRSMIEHIGAMVLENPLIIEARKVQELFEVHGQASARHRDNPMLLYLHAMIAEGVERGELRPVDPERMTMLLFIVIDNLFFQTRELYHMPSGLEDEAFGEEAWRFIERGLKGIER